MRRSDKPKVRTVLAVAGYGVPVTQIRHEHGRDVFISTNGIAWVVPR